MDKYKKQLRAEREANKALLEKTRETAPKADGMPKPMLNTKFVKP